MIGGETWVFKRMKCANVECAWSMVQVTMLKGACSVCEELGPLAMPNNDETFAVSDTRRFTRRLTLPLTRTPEPPRQIHVTVGKGYHLFLGGGGDRQLHVIIHPAGTERPGLYVSAISSLAFRCHGGPNGVERRWLAALRRGLRLVEQDRAWAAFLGWAARQPQAMLPDVTFDPARDPSNGNLECIRVETRCNGRCRFCSARGILPDLVVDARRVGERLHGMRRAGRSEVAFTGGEPTLREDLPALVARAREEGFTSICLQTNAMLLDDGPLVERLVQAGLTSVFVPLLSNEAATHDVLMGVTGAFARTVAGIDRCRAEGLHVSFNTVITRVNLEHLEPLMAWLSERFSPPTIEGNISYIALQGWAVDHLELVPRIDEVRPYLKAALDTCTALGLDILVPGICGLPMCVLPGYERYFDEYHRGVRGMPENRRYGAACLGCTVRPRCSGFWSVYLDLFGEGELGYQAGSMSSLCRRPLHDSGALSAESEVIP